MSANMIFAASFWHAVLADIVLYAQCFGILALLCVLVTAIGRRWPRHT